MPVPLDKIELPFQWTCPGCGWQQTDTVNPIHGPFVSVTCGKCQMGFAEDELSTEDRESFDTVGAEAERLTGEGEQG